jgi:hypothetical protein
MSILLFGSNNPSGAAFLKLCSEHALEIWGRNCPEGFREKYVYCDLTLLPSKKIKMMNGILVSFAPIWLLASFIEHLYKFQPEMLKELKGVIACSSSSFITKRFAFNDHDKMLSKKLSWANDVITNICKLLEIPSQILAPTLIYGESGGYTDKNLSKIIQLLRLLPFIILPKETGLRQPIHAMQLASVAAQQSGRMLSSCWNFNEPEILILGGDSNITYEAMIQRIKDKLVSTDKARKCRIVIIPNTLFFFFVALVLPFNPKLFEAIMRIKSDLSGFTETHNILCEAAQEFPVLPLATGSYFRN